MKNKQKGVSHLRFSSGLEKVFWIALVATGIVALARYFHPATFSPNVVLLLLAVSFTSGVIFLTRQS